MSEGWVALHRKLQNNDLWKSEPFTRGQAWVDLIILANHEEGFFYKRGNKIVVKRGQVGYSQKALSDRWKWSRTKVRKFLCDLEKEQQIKQHKSHVTTLITLINYDEYQHEKQQKNNRKTTEKQQKNTNNNVNNNNNVNKTILSELNSDDFDRAGNSDDKINWTTVRFHERVSKRYGHHKNIKKATLQDWRDHIRLMHEQDELSFKEIWGYIKFVFQDEFWKDTVKSTSGLRNNWEEIDSSINRSKGKHKKEQQQFRTDSIHI